MEASQVPKIIRWRIYLQGFNFLVRHISGRENVVADCLSRLHTDDDSPHSVQALEETAERDPISSDPKTLLSSVHNGRMGHFGARKTWTALNQHFPGHRIPFRVVEDFVATCPTCQKDRLGMTDTLQPVVRHLKPEHHRSVVGIDTLTVTPPDDYGNSYVTVVVNHFTKLVALYPSKSHDAKASADALTQYFCTYGLFDCIMTDPGTEFKNQLMEHLTRYFGIRHRFSIVDRPQSNGVEGSNKQILRHLKALVIDERLMHSWSSPTVLCLIQFLINSQLSSETGQIPLITTFGRQDELYSKLPEEGDSAALTHAYVKLLDENLRNIRAASKAYQLKLVKERTSKTPAEKQNMFQPGDYVLWQLNPEENLPSKLTAKFAGPYEVLQQSKNDVDCKHVTLGHIKTFHVSRLKLFFGSKDEAIRAALHDQSQYEIDKILSYSGDPMKRITMDFKTLFKDGSIVWVPYGQDIFSTVQFEEFCLSRSELVYLTYTAEVAATFIKRDSTKPILDVKPGEHVLVSLRYFGHLWFDSLAVLPDRYESDYRVECVYGAWVGKSRTKIDIKAPIFNITLTVSYLFVKLYGSSALKASDPTVKIVDKSLLAKFPMLKPSY
jgi:hypothetical protein